MALWRVYRALFSIHRALLSVRMARSNFDLHVRSFCFGLYICLFLALYMEEEKGKLFPLYIGLFLFIQGSLKCT